MEPTVLHELLQQARAENKAVQLYGGNNLDTLKFIIEPEHQVENKPGNTIYVDGRLIDLKFIAMALIVPNNEDRVKELKRIEQEIHEYYDSNPKGCRNGRLSL